MTTIRPVKYEPSFEGKHNSVKSKAFIVLYSLREESRGITARELAARAGINHRSLITLLARWQKWRYVSRSNDKPMLSKIRDKGIKWLTRWYPIMPFERYIEEIKEARLKKERTVWPDTIKSSK